MIRIADERRKARKPHRCSLCYRMIDPGETYSHGRFADAGDIWTFRQCAHCEAFLAIVRHAYNFDEYWEEGWSTDDVIAWGDELHGPKHLSAMRLYVMWRRDWRRHDGTLYPIPEREKASTR